MADRIVVLRNGRVVEHGDRTALPAAGGDYARMWRPQERARGWRLDTPTVHS